MAFFAASLGVIILLWFVTFSAANRDKCDLYATVGQSLTLPFVYERLRSTDELRWIHGNTIIFKRQQGRVPVGKQEDVSLTGSLLLKNLKSSSAGIYQAEVFHPNGTLAKTWTGYLCVMDKVPKPHLSFICDYKSDVVTLNCFVAKPQDFMFSWTLDGRSLSETRHTLSIPLMKLKDGGSITCSMANKVSKEWSDTVHPTCKRSASSPSSPTMVCFASKAVVAAVAGAGSLILLLLIIIVILCWCCKRNRTSRRREKGELRMLSMTQRFAEPVSSDYETMHDTKTSPPPSPKPSPRATCQNVCPPAVQSESRLLHSSTSAEGQKPSPVPKPRTKRPQTPDV